MRHREFWRCVGESCATVGGLNMRSDIRVSSIRIDPQSTPDLALKVGKLAGYFCADSFDPTVSVHYPSDDDVDRLPGPFHILKSSELAPSVPHLWRILETN